MQMQLFIAAAVFGSYVVKAESIERIGCISGISYLYSGKRSTTREGIECQRWDRRKPHEVRHVPSDGGKHNFCRNPDKDMKGTWCYTTDPEVRWDYCEIPKCPTEAVIMWNSVDESRNFSTFSEVNADLEYMSQKYDKNGDTDAAYSRSWEDSSFRAFDTNFDRKLIFFTDVKGNYFGIYDMETKAIEKFLQGMTENIEAISYDWVTNNFYWTDSKLKSVMVADSTLESHYPVYRTRGGNRPYALEVHSVKRLLIFSTYLRKTPEHIGAKIITADLAGQNEKVIFDYPDVVKVVALTIDYTEDRIYWIEDLGYGSKVVSSKTDGTDKVQQHTADDAVYHDIAVYSDYIYTSDNRKRYNFFGELRYHVQVITKNSDQIAHYKLTEKPMGIATYENNQFQRSTKPRGPGECIGTCNGICLPTLKGKRRCACSVGYHLQPKTNKCITKLVADEYLLVVDVNEGHAYQISLDYNEKYSIAPLGKASQVTSIAVDPSIKYAYFSDARSGSVSRGILDDGLNLPLITSVARYMEIDPLVGNVFYSDGKTIALLNADGSVGQVIVKTKNEASDIKAFALDITDKYLYWTDTFSEEGAGKVMRCRFDGSEQKVVFDNLNRPHGISIDFQTHRLYIVESKKASVYELSLAKMAKIIKSTSLKQQQIKKYDLRTSITSKNFLLTEIKVHDGAAYIVDEGQTQVQRLDLGKPTKLTGFGPAIFYKATSLSIYSKDAYKDLMTSGVSRPCQMKSCQLCVEVSKQQAKCLESAKKRKGNS